MTGDKVAKQLERDAVAYKAGFADGYRAAKAEQILCKECKHRPSDPHNEQCGNRIEFPDDVCPCQCGDPWYNYMPEDDWYCASAERKEE